MVLNALADEEVHEANDGRVIRGRLILRRAHDLLEATLLLKRGRERGEFAIRAVVAVDGGEEIGAFHDDRPRSHVGCRAHVIQGKHVARVDHGDR